ncbi:MAG: hypothetical protein ACK4WJ_00945 [Endomicrobiia bacterium]
MVGLFSFYSYKYSNNKTNLEIFNFIISILFLFFLKSFSSIFIIFAFILFSYSKKIFLNITILLSFIILGIVFNFDSFLNRIIWMIIGFKVWTKHFLFGTGLNTFKFFYQQHVLDLTQPTIATIFVHNYFLHLSTEIGFIGLVFILSIIYFAISKISLNNKIYFYPVLGIIIQNLIDYNLLIPQNSILFFIFLSYIIEPKNYIKKWQKFGILFFIIILFLQGFVLNSKLQKIDFLLKSNNKYNLKEVVEMDKTCWYGLRKLAIIELKNNNINSAENFFIQAVKYNPYDAESFLYLSLINFNFGRKKEGYKFFIKSIKLNPKAADRYKKFIEEIKK